MTKTSRRVIEWNGRKRVVGVPQVERTGGRRRRDDGRLARRGKKGLVGLLFSIPVLLAYKTPISNTGYRLMDHWDYVLRRLSSSRSQSNPWWASSLKEAPSLTYIQT